MSLREELERLKKALEDWERKLGLTQAEMDVSQVESILTMDRGRLSDLSSAEAAEAAFVLAQFAWLIQRRENQCRAFLQWARTNREKFTGPERRGLESVMLDAEVKSTRIQYLGKRLEFMAQCLQAVQRTRYREEKHESH